jgi:WD40-like Beta Propeller Repeat
MKLQIIFLERVIVKNNYRQFVSTILVICTWVAYAKGQTAPPAADIFLIDMKLHSGQIALSQPVQITEWQGYDNQPSFLPDGKNLLYTSIRDDGQADIYRYNIADNTITRITQTFESEFSPTVTPDGKFFSVVRVEKDSTQRLWKFPLTGGEPALVLETVKPVGYHAWADANTVALFILGNPLTLQIADLRTGKAEIVAENIGRSLRKIPKQEAISFVHKVGENEWLIKRLDLKTHAITTLVKALPGSEYCAWTPQDILLMAQDSKLFQCDFKVNSDWQEIADFADAGLKGITRLAVSPKGDRLAVVAISTR